MGYQAGNIIHYNKEIAAKLQELNKPLADNFPFSFFAYRRFYNDGNLLYLFNNPMWMEFCFQNSRWHSNSFWQKVAQMNDRQCFVDIWPDFPQDDPVFNAMYSFDMWNGMVCYQKHEDYIEAIAFVSTRENPQVKLFYLNNMGLINSYVTFFKSKGHDLINSKDKDLLIPYSLDTMPDDDVRDSNIATFLKQTQLRSYSLTIGLRDVLLTKREMECICCLSRGATIKEAAKLLGLSPRTVEHYLNLAKEKAHVKGTSELLYAFSKNENVVSSSHFYLNC
jgi:DNA-binding CsgD family transcriptional regulator